jgi:hypothetical protein
MENTPSLGGGISAEAIWGKKYEKGMRKRGKTRQKGLKGKEKEKRSKKKINKKLKGKIRAK